MHWGPWPQHQVHGALRWSAIKSRPDPGQTATKCTYLEQIAKQDGPLALAKGAMRLDELDQLANLPVYPPEVKNGIRV